MERPNLALDDRRSPVTLGQCAKPNDAVGVAGEANRQPLYVPSCPNWPIAAQNRKIRRWIIGDKGADPIVAIAEIDRQDGESRQRCFASPSPRSLVPPRRRERPSQIARNSESIGQLLAKRDGHPVPVRSVENSISRLQDLGHEERLAQLERAFGPRVPALRSVAIVVQIALYSHQRRADSEREIAAHRRTGDEGMIF